MKSKAGGWSSEHFMSTLDGLPVTFTYAAPTTHEHGALSWVYTHPFYRHTKLPELPGVQKVIPVNAIHDQDVIAVIPLRSPGNPQTFKVLHLTSPSVDVSSRSLRLRTTHVASVPREFLRKHATRCLAPYIMEIFTNPGSKDLHVALDGSHAARKTWSQVVKPLLEAMGLVEESLKVHYASSDLSGRCGGEVKGGCHDIAQSITRRACRGEKVMALAIGHCGFRDMLGEAIKESRASAQFTEGNETHPTDRLARQEKWKAPYLGSIRLDGSRSQMCPVKGWKGDRLVLVRDLKAFIWSD